MESNLNGKMSWHKKSFKGIDKKIFIITEGGLTMGLDAQVMSFRVLEHTWHEDENPAWREHVTPCIYCHPGKFPLRAVVNDKNYSYMRWTVSTSEDLSFVRFICEHFGHDGFSWYEVLALLDEYPECLEINKHVQQKVV